jgi:hypothetical protein
MHWMIVSFESTPSEYHHDRTEISVKRVEANITGNGIFCKKTSRTVQGSVEVLAACI